MKQEDKISSVASIFISVQGCKRKKEFYMFACSGIAGFNKLALKVNRLQTKSTNGNGKQQ